ncbi:glycosyltransferase [Chitinimonas lacunae]|uniref:Glycosyltransferase n=1 Tax=Chitinimonas lacunae TaxID=1963018 RepID=A0ABV8MU76_9NEIS
MEPTAPAITGKRVLIFRPYGISINHFAIELAVCGQLQLAGAEVQWLVCDAVFEQCDHHWQLINPEDKASACSACFGTAQRYRDDYGLRLEGLGTWLDATDRAEVTEWLAQLPVDHYGEASFRGLPLGEWVRSSVNTQLRCWIIELNDPRHAAAYRQYLYGAALAAIVFEKYFAARRPDYIFMMNGRTFAPRTLLEMAKARGIPVAVHEFGRSEETRMLRADENCHSLEGFNRAWTSWAELPLTPTEAAEVAEHLKRRIGGSVDFAYNKHNDSSLAAFVTPGETRRIVTLFTSSTDEIASAKGWGWHYDQLQWLAEVIAYFRHHPEYLLVIRCHPNHRHALMGDDYQFLGGLERLLADMPDNVRLIRPSDKCNSYELLALAHAVLVYSSTVAMEAALLGCRVLLAGGGLYRGRRFAYEYEGPLADFQLALDAFLSSDVDQRWRTAAARFFHFLYYKQVYDVPLVERVEGRFLVCRREAFSQPVLDWPLFNDLLRFYREGGDFFPDPSGRPRDAAAAAVESTALALELTPQRLGWGGGAGTAAPCFSVVLTTYNRAELLGDAVRSVLEQSCGDFELIVVNDAGAPVEATLAPFLDDGRILYLRHAVNRGLSAARNTALALVRGRYICYLDDDDLMRPEHLATIKAALDRDDVVLVYTDAEYVAERIEGGQRVAVERATPYAAIEYSRERLQVENFIAVNAWGHRRELIERIGGFDPALPALEDWEFLLRVLKVGEIRHLPVVTVEVHLRPEQDADRMSKRQRKNFPRLFRDIYARYPVESAAVQEGRRARLASLDAEFQGKATPPVKALAAPSAYDIYRASRRFGPRDGRLFEQRLQSWERLPVFQVVVLHPDTRRSEALSRTVGALARQYYPELRLTVVAREPAPQGWQGERLCWIETDGALYGGVNRALNEIEADWLMVIHAGDTLAAHGLLLAAELGQCRPELVAIYGDEDRLDGERHDSPQFKPDFNLEFLRSGAYIGQPLLVRVGRLRELGGFDAVLSGVETFDLALKLAEHSHEAPIGHLAEVIYHADPIGEPALPPGEARAHARRALVQHFARLGVAVEVGDGLLPGSQRVRYLHDARPLVSIVIPTRDQLNFLQRCLETIVERTSYNRYEVLVVDNGSETPEARAFLDGIEAMGEERLRVLRYPHPFNFSAMNNLAARHAQGDYLLLLNNDTAVVQNDWIEALLNHAQRPEVGIVGAKLLFPDGRVQHAGVVLGMLGPAEHPFLGASLREPGYMGRLQVDQEYSAVTAACLMIRKSIYEEVGGLDESDFKVSYNDVDLCLKVRERGYRIVWTPYATLLHEGSASQRNAVEGRPDEARQARFAGEQRAFYRKWLPQLVRDPAYNPNLSLRQRDCAIETNPVLTRRFVDWQPAPSILVHPADQTGCGHYRILAPGERLLETGRALVQPSYELFMLPAEIARIKADAIVLQRQLTPVQLEAMARYRDYSGAFMVYELDDYLPNLPVKSVHREHMPKDLVKSLRKALGYVDRFVVSTEPLAEALEGFHPNLRVVHNYLHPDWWQATPRRRVGPRPRVGWAGGIGHSGDLALIVEVVRDLAPEVDWVFFGMMPKEIEPFVAEYHAGVPTGDYPAKLAALDLDLALAPLEINTFNLCKSNLRLLEYGINGYPVIATDIAPYRCGLPVTLVKNKYKDWMEAIRAHLADLDAAARQGDELREAVRRDWMLDGDNLDRWLKAWLPD